jgi:Icc protein
VTIVQLSDLHLDLDEPNPHGVDVWDNFAWALDTVATIDHDLILITGDLALREGSARTYRAIADNLTGRSLNALVIPGNHDDRTLFFEAFGRRYLRTGHGTSTLDASVHTGGTPIYLVDTQDGRISRMQLSWVDSRLDAHANAARRGEYSPRTLFAVHHPIICGFHRYMDQSFRLENAEDVVNVLSRYAGELDITILCGHYHIDHDTTLSGIRQLTCPSLYVQIDPGTDTFAVTSTIPGFRVVSWNDRSIDTYTVFRSSDGHNVAR